MKSQHTRRGKFGSVLAMCLMLAGSFLSLDVILNPGTASAVTQQYNVINRNGITTKGFYDSVADCVAKNSQGGRNAGVRCEPIAGTEVAPDPFFKICSKTSGLCQTNPKQYSDQATCERINGAGGRTPSTCQQVADPNAPTPAPAAPTNPIQPPFSGNQICNALVTTNCVKQDAASGSLTDGSGSATSGDPGVTISPNTNIALRTTNITKLGGWLAYLALVACVIGVCVSAALWALGSKGQNPGQELTGKKGFILCMTAAFFVGAVNPMLAWLDDIAGQADTTGVTATGVLARGGSGGSAADNAGAAGGTGAARDTSMDGNGTVKAVNASFTKCFVSNNSCSTNTYSSYDDCIKSNGGRGGQITCTVGAPPNVSSAPVFKTYKRCLNNGLQCTNMKFDSQQKCLQSTGGRGAVTCTLTNIAEPSLILYKRCVGTNCDYVQASDVPTCVKSLSGSSCTVANPATKTTIRDNSKV